MLWLQVVTSLPFQEIMTVRLTNQPTDEHDGSSKSYTSDEDKSVSLFLSEFLIMYKKRTQMCTIWWDFEHRLTQICIICWDWEHRSVLFAEIKNAGLYYLLRVWTQCCITSWGWIHRCVLFLKMRTQVYIICWDLKHRSVLFVEVENAGCIIS